MRNVAAADIKQHFAQYLDSALIEPIVIENSGHPSVVMLSIAEYERLQSLDDSWWGKKAQLALESGFVGADETMRRIQKRLDLEYCAADIIEFLI